MSTSSALPAGSSANIFTVEEAITLLIPRLGLNETETNKPGKGKGSVGFSSSDADFALRIQAEDLVNAVQMIEDTRFARRLEESQSDDLVNPVSGPHLLEIALGLLDEGGLSVPSYMRPAELDPRLKFDIVDASQSAEKFVEQICLAHRIS